MAFGTQREYVLKTTVDEKTYRTFARLAENDKRSLSQLLRILVESRVAIEYGRKA